MIISGYEHSLLAQADGTVLCWGNPCYNIDPNSKTEPGIPTVIEGLSGVKAITAALGHQCSYALLDDGTLRVWGWNTFKHFATGRDEEYTMAPAPVKGIDGVASVAAGVSHALALRKDGSVWAWGCNENGELGIGTYDDNTSNALGNSKSEPVKTAVLRDAVEISAGCTHAMAVTADGGVWSWGGNSSMQLGKFAGDKRCLPERII